MIDGKKLVHLLIVTDAWFPQVNGVVRSLTHTRVELIARGHKVSMLTPEEFKTFPCPTYPEIRLSLFPGSRVAKIIRQHKPDVIHIATEGPLGIAARNFCIRNNMLFTSAYHTRFPEYIYSRIKLPLFMSYAFIRWFHKPSEAVMTPTLQVISELKDWQISNTALWPRGVDLTLFSPPKRRTRNAKPVLLYVGRVAVEKNIEDFLNIKIDAEKWIVGDGPALTSLKSRFPDAKFFGMKAKEELPEFYGKADIFVFPSKTDTFGLVLLEAMACGLPVAAYPVSGPIDVVGNSDAGILDDNLEIAVKKALRIPRKSARTHAEKFSWTKATDIFESYLVYRQDKDEYSSLNNPHKNNSGITRAFKAFANSYAGLRFAINEESAFRQELLLVAIMLPITFWLPASSSQKLLMIGSLLLILITELLNSSIEAAIDRISFEQHGLSKRAKDYGSAAVFLSLIFSAIVYITVIYQIMF